MRNYISVQQPTTNMVHSTFMLHHTKNRLHIDINNPTFSPDKIRTALPAPNKTHVAPFC